MARTPRSRLDRQLFLAFFGAYATTAVILLLVGLASSVAAISPPVLASLRTASADGPAGPLWRGIADASLTAPPIGEVLLDYTASALNISFAVLVVRLRPDHWSARLLAIGAVGTAAAFNLAGHGVFLSMRESVVNALHFLFHSVSGVAYLHALLLFPDGRLVPAWARWPLILFYGIAAIEVVSLAFGPGPGALMSRVVPLERTGEPGVDLRNVVAADAAFYVFFFGLLIPVVGLTGQLQRYRTAKVAEARQQAKLLLWALSLAFTGGLLFAGTIVAINQRGGATFGAEDLERIESVVFRIFPLLFLIIPGALCVGLVRYGLWDIDRIINRTLVYSATTAVLAATFALVSALANRSVEFLTGQRTDAVTVVTALLTALAFTPLQRRFRSVVDRVLPPRALLTFLFTDIVGSTTRAAKLGDARWREALERYRSTVRRDLRSHGGREVDAPGDGFFATFEKPSNAVRCARDIRQDVLRLGLSSRTGLHRGECEMRGEKVSGLSVHVASRVVGVAEPGEILLTDAVREAIPDAVLGRGAHVLKGVDGTWPLYRIVSA